MIQMDQQRCLNAQMHSYTQSTSASVQQLPMSLVWWTESMVKKRQVPDFLRVMMMIPVLQQLSDQRVFHKLLETTERQRIELLKIAKIDSETYQEAIDKAERDDLWKNLRTRSLTLHNLITDKMQIMSIANLESSAKHVGQNQMEIFGLFESYLEKSGARKDQIAAFRDMVKILRSSFAQFLHIQHCSLNAMQADQGEQPIREKRRAHEEEKKFHGEILGGEKYRAGSERVPPKRTGLSSRK